MSSDNSKLSVHVNIEISASALQAIVSHAKQVAEKKGGGVYRIDTADQVSAMISRFLSDKDFDGYVQEVDNYPPFSE